MLSVFGSLAACTGSADDGTGDDDGPGGGTWSGTATVHGVDGSGNATDTTADVTWTAVSSDEDGVDYAPGGTVTAALTVPGCTVVIDPATHAIGLGDGFLRVDAATYRGAAGSTWSVMMTFTCPPNPPTTMPSMIAAQWLNAPAPTPLTAPDRIAGHLDQGQIQTDWAFTRSP